MKLAAAVIKADGMVEESEKQILSAYANEMQIPVCNLDKQDDMTQVIKEFATTSTLQTKRIVFLELLALAFADGNYTVEEKELVQKLADAFKFEDTFVERAINLEDSYVTAYTSLINLIEKGE